MGLVLNIIAFWLCNIQSLDIQFLMSKSGERIFLVIKADEKDL